VFDLDTLLLHGMTLLILITVDLFCNTKIIEDVPALNSPCIKLFSLIPHKHCWVKKDTRK